MSLVFIIKRKKLYIRSKLKSGNFLQFLKENIISGARKYSVPAFDLPAAPAPVSKSAGRYTSGHISIRVPEVHCRTLFSAGARGAGALNEPTVEFTFDFVPKISVHGTSFINRHIVTAPRTLYAQLKC